MRFPRQREALKFLDPGILTTLIPATFGRSILYTTTTTQRGLCTECSVSILVQSQSHKSLPGGGGVQNLSSHTRSAPAHLQRTGTPLAGTGPTADAGSRPDMTHLRVMKRRAANRTGTNGVSTDGVTAIFCLFF